MQDATALINEDYGETVPTNSREETKHETYNSGLTGNEKCASLVHLIFLLLHINFLK
jgi:hypothetical protein